MGNNTFKVTSCEVCGSETLATVLNLGAHPMCDDLVHKTEDRACKEYPIEILYCNTCYTAHQKFQIPKAELFPSSYHYRSRFTADVLNGMKNLVARTEEVFGDLKGKKVIDIGCNDGSLLDFFRERGTITIGVEPTGAYADAKAKGHTVYNEFFTTDIAKQLLEENGVPDFICFTNVFAHIEDLKGVIDALNLLSNLGTKIIIENHYLGAVLSGNQFDTFYHEHPRTYSHRSFMYISQSLKKGIINVDFPSRYGGNIRVFIGDASFKSENVSYDANQVEEREAKFVDQFAAMNIGIEQWTKNKKAIINNYVKAHGKLKGKAFPGRAAILVKLLNLDETLISAVYEKPGSMKINHYLPGTKIPILSDDELLSNTNLNEPILNLAWHISAEIKTYLQNNNYTGDIIDILSMEDFK
jgi:SAM-dependent methyltransferase